ncbi:MAG: Hsp20/alpha crystallin family protein [Acidobacteriota bacterium]|nr:Hsp20/alpha crystallin family protein [Acidobacteriota bacterium]
MSRVTGSLSPLTAELSEQMRVHLRRMLVRLDELRALASNPATWTPPVDVCEIEDAILINIELPGVSINQVRIKILDNVLKVEGQKERTTPTARLLTETERPIRFICLERSYGSFSLSVPINCQIEPEQVTANLREGVLQIQMPKAKTCGREITISITE